MCDTNPIDCDSKRGRAAANTVLRRLGALLRPYRAKIIIATIVLVGQTAGLLAGPALVRAGVDQGLLAKDGDAYRPFAIRTGLDDKQAQTVNERLPRLPGASLQHIAVRHYPEPDLYSHLLGYVGPIDAEAYRTLKQTGYLPDEVVGKAGLAAGLEDVLRGQDGWPDVLTDAHWQMGQVIRPQTPVRDRTIYRPSGRALRR